MKRLFVLVLVATLLISLGWIGSREPANPLKSAERAFRRGDFLRAVQIYDAVQPALVDPGHASFNRAAALYELGALDQAATDYHAAGSTGDALRAARSLYDLGNCALRRACQTSARPDARLLREAVGHYDLCLAQSGGGDQKLIDDAAHNLQIACRLLTQSESEPQAPQRNALKNPNADDECEH